MPLKENSINLAILDRFDILWKKGFVQKSRKLHIFIFLKLSFIDLSLLNHIL